MVNVQLNLLETLANISQHKLLVLPDQVRLVAKPLSIANLARVHFIYSETFGR